MRIRRAVAALITLLVAAGIIAAGTGSALAAYHDDGLATATVLLD
jgi:hypothetical protein